MEEYIRVNAGFLVDRYEFFGGRKAHDKVLKAREKEVKAGTAVVVEEFSSHEEKKKLYRKGSN